MTDSHTRRECSPQRWNEFNNGNRTISPTHTDTVVISPVSKKTFD